MKKSFLILLAITFVMFTACSKQASHDNMDHSAHTGGEKAAADTTQAIWKLPASKTQPQTNTTISLQIQDAKGKPVEKFDVVHEKNMHLIVVSKDLAYFNHIHPEYKGKGQFEVTTQFPAAGEYKLIADYAPSGSGPVNKSNWVTVDGAAPALAPIVPDTKLVQVVDGKEVTLSFDHLMAGMELGLNFHIVDKKSMQPIKDLEPYLGAVGHVVILTADAGNYLHVHPTDEKAKGPDAKFMTSFPKSGVYKIWGQFQQNGKTFVVPFVVKVP
jgi:hypothetical protein